LLSPTSDTRSAMTHSSKLSMTILALVSRAHAGSFSSYWLGPVRAASPRGCPPSRPEAAHSFPVQGASRTVQEAAHSFQRGCVRAAEAHGRTMIGRHPTGRATKADRRPSTYEDSSFQRAATLQPHQSFAGVLVANGHRPGNRVQAERPAAGRRARVERCIHLGETVARALERSILAAERPVVSSAAVDGVLLS